ncbi:MAG: hypothetical protein ACI9DK_002184 [Vicingaceae bacterium]
MDDFTFLPVFKEINLKATKKNKSVTKDLMRYYFTAKILDGASKE